MGELPSTPQISISKLEDLLSSKKPVLKWKTRPLLHVCLFVAEGMVAHPLDYSPTGGFAQLRRYAIPHPDANPFLNQSLLGTGQDLNPQPLVQASGLPHLTGVLEDYGFHGYLQAPKWVPTHGHADADLPCNPPSSPLQTYAIHKCEQVRSLPYLTLPATECCFMQEIFR